MLALDYLNAHMCDCGLPDWVADTDPQVKTQIHRVCPICKGLAVDQRVQDAADEAQMKHYGDQIPPNAPRPDDGRHTSHQLAGDGE